MILSSREATAREFGGKFKSQVGSVLCLGGIACIQKVEVLLERKKSGTEGPSGQ